MGKINTHLFFIDIKHKKTNKEVGNKKKLLQVFKCCKKDTAEKNNQGDKTT